MALTLDGIDRCLKAIVGWQNAARLLKRQRDEAQARCRDLLGAIASYQLHTNDPPVAIAVNLAKAKLAANDHLRAFITEAG